MDEQIAEGDGGRALRADARRNRARVLEAAWRLLATKEPELLSMEEVAREAAIGKGTLYRHYPSKESLFAALTEAGIERIAGRMHERIPPEADAPTKLRAVVALLYEVYEEYGINIDLLLNARLSCRDRSEQAVDAMVARVRAILAQGIRESSFRSLDLDYTAVAVFSLINPVAFVKQRERLGYSRAELEERTVDLLLHALSAE